METHQEIFKKFCEETGFEESEKDNLSLYVYTEWLEKKIKAMAHQTMLDAVRALKCCGNCFYMDIIQDKGGVCTCGNGEIPCDRCGYCDDWKIDKRE